MTRRRVGVVVMMLVDQLEAAAGRERLAGAAEQGDVGVGVAVDRQPHVGELAVHVGADRVEPGPSRVMRRTPSAGRSMVRPPKWAYGRSSRQHCSSRPSLRCSSSRRRPPVPSAPPTARSTSAPGSATSTPVIPHPEPPAWTARDAQQRRLLLPADAADARRNPAFRGQETQQTAIETAEFAVRRSPSGRRSRTGCTPTAAPARGEGRRPFRSPEEWAATGRGRPAQVLVHQPATVPSSGPGCTHRPIPRGRYRRSRSRPACSRTTRSTPGSRRAWPKPATSCSSSTRRVRATARAAGTSPTARSRPARRPISPTTPGRRSTSSCRHPPSRTRGHAARTPTGTPTYNPFWANVDRRTSASPATRSARSPSRRSAQQDNAGRCRRLLRQPRPLLDAWAPRRTPDAVLRRGLRIPGDRHTHDELRPIPNSTSARSTSLLRPASTRCRSPPVRATTTSSATSPIPATFRPAGTASGSPSITHWPGSTGTSRATARPRTASRPSASTARRTRTRSGAGTYDAAKAAAHPDDPFAGNVPYKIGGKCSAEPAVVLLRVRLPLRGRRAALVRHATTGLPLREPPRPVVR